MWFPKLYNTCPIPPYLVPSVFIITSTIIMTFIIVLVTIIFSSINCCLCNIYIDFLEKKNGKKSNLAFHSKKAIKYKSFHGILALQLGMNTCVNNCTTFNVERNPAITFSVYQIITTLKCFYSMLHSIMSMFWVFF